MDCFHCQLVTAIRKFFREESMQEQEWLSCNSQWATVSVYHFACSTAILNLFLLKTLECQTNCSTQTNWHLIVRQKTQECKETDQDYHFAACVICCWLTTSYILLLFNTAVHLHCHDIHYADALYNKLQPCKQPNHSQLHAKSHLVLPLWIGLPVIHKNGKSGCGKHIVFFKTDPLRLSCSLKK